MGLTQFYPTFLIAGRKVNQNGSISVTIVIIISWLVMGMVVFALAQYSTLRRISQEEEEEEEAAAAAAAAEAAALVRSQLAKPPIMQTTPPTPSPQSNGGGGSILSPASSSARSTTAVSSSSMSSSSKSIWLPSVGALQLSDSSILKRRESAKRKRKAKQNRYKYYTVFLTFYNFYNVSKVSNFMRNIGCICFKSLFSSCNKSRIRHRSSDVDQATISWIEMGLERVHSEDDIRINALRKWHGFLKQHVMQTLEQVRFFFHFTM